MGNRAQDTEYVHALIKSCCPEAKTVLEMACGTGEIIKNLQSFYKVDGLDISDEMVAIAKNKLPKSNIFKSSMESFSASQKYDAILCLFDSINHLQDFSSWERTFANAYQHLNQGGIFIFDYNTINKLKIWSERPSILNKMDNHFYSIKVTKKEDMSSYVWNIMIFENQNNSNYLLHHEEIEEVSFPLQQIHNSLEKIYQSVKLMTADNKPPSEESNRIFFVCKKDE